MEKNNKWIHDYIEDVNLENIEWLVIPGIQLYNFLMNNYYNVYSDIDWDLAADETLDYNVVFGMQYLSFDAIDREYNYLLGVANNNIGKKTIIADIMFADEYYLFEDQKTPMTFLTFTEVNKYFWRKGIYKKMCEELVNHINPNQHILITDESEMGSVCETRKILEEILLKNGFKKKVFVKNDDTLLNCHDEICANEKTI
ncbi:MAG: hypothetical protein J1F35_04370 [Erysipelotrichales bacterium]|nr:hypothetical protein [Erysipelotrichales bacterium]